ncbi:MAG: DUF523 domain-containing protein [Campylobacterota bacterium]|nr:DUF523 domain-containing protein [Campylobacterota bacterium]
MREKPKVIISACLLGHICRYDGKTKKTDEVVEKFKGYEIVPFCPEDPLFGTPRQRISVVEIEGQNRVITDESKRDVTSLLKEEIDSFIALHKDAKKIILKSKSPSCGVGTTPVLNQKREILYYGNGIAGDMFLEKFSPLDISNV